MSPTQEPKERLIGLDLLRGFLIFAIIVNHAQRAPGVLEYITGGSRMWVSAAEFFFLLSGFSFAYIRRRTLEKKGWLPVLNATYRRVILIYLLFIATSVGLLYWANALGCNPGGRNIGASPCDPLTAETFWRILSLQSGYYWANILAHYTMYLSAAPLILFFLTKRLWWIPLGVSVYLYSISGINWYLSFQILFVIGCLIGFWWRPLATSLRQLPAHMRKTGIALLIGATAVTYFISLFYTDQRFNQFMIEHVLALLDVRVPAVGIVDAARDSLASYQEAGRARFDRTIFGPYRLGLALIWFAFFVWLFNRYERLIQRNLGWLLVPFGQLSLWAFALHAPVVFGFNVWFDGSSSSVLCNTFLALVVVAATFLLLIVGFRLLVRDKLFLTRQR
jgi:hypothetical protein